VPRSENQAEPDGAGALALSHESLTKLKKVTRHK
jgi:hypothetical protein